MPKNESMDINSMESCPFKWKVLQYESWGLRVIEAGVLGEDVYYAKLVYAFLDTYVEISWSKTRQEGKVEFFGSVSKEYPNVFKF